MLLSVTRSYAFESAHFLPKVPDTHKCKRLHGHHYKLEVEIALEGGEVLDPAGFVLDFWDLDAIMSPIIDRVDHRLLNDVHGLQNPTAESIAAWFFAEIQSQLTRLDRQIKLCTVRVWETPDCSAVVIA